MENDDTHIIKGIRSGDEAAFRLMFESWYQRLVVFSNKYLDDLEAARDLVQEFFAYLWENGDTIDIKTSLKSYLFEAIRNRSLNYIKFMAVRTRHKEKVLRQEMENQNSLEEMIDAAELEDKIIRLVAALPDQCRRIYTMSRGDGKSNPEIATELNLSIRTVETQISKALKTLREKLMPER